MTPGSDADAYYSIDQKPANTSIDLRRLKTPGAKAVRMFIVTRQEVKYIVEVFDET